MSNRAYADYLVGLAAYHGHDPRDAREYSLRDLQLIAMIHRVHGGVF